MRRNVRGTRSVVYSILFKAYNVQCIVNTYQCTVYCVPYTLHSVQFTVHSVHFTIPQQPLALADNCQFTWRGKTPLQCSVVQCSEVL